MNAGAFLQEVTVDNFMAALFYILQVEAFLGGDPAKVKTKFYVLQNFLALYLKTVI